jgi:RNA-dependent RNA polymerase
VHLSLKVERLLSAKEFFDILPEEGNEARKRIVPNIIYCKNCKEPFGNESLIGPKRIGVFCFSSNKVCFHFPDTGAREQVSRKNWKALQEKYECWVEKRSFESFYPAKAVDSSNENTMKVVEAVEPQEIVPSIVFPTIEIMRLINPNSLTKTNPRKYQIELLLFASLSNTLVYLPTGCGKTLVSAMYISLMKILNPKRLIVFLVSKVPLAYQQAHYLKEETSLHTIVLCGESIREIYYEDIYSYDVIVFTAQVFLNYLSSGQISLSRISCVVIDEVHNATGSHPFSLFFDTYYEEFPDQKKPMLMTLSASPMELECETERSLFKLNQLCSLIWCDIYTPIVYLKDMYSYCAVPTPYYYVIPEDSSESAVLQSIEKYILRLFRKYYSLLGISSINHLPEWSSILEIRTFLGSFDNNSKLNDSTLHLINHIKQVMTCTEMIRVIGYTEAVECLKEIRNRMESEINQPWFVEDTKILHDLISDIIAHKREYSNRYVALEEFLVGDDKLQMGSKVLLFVKCRKTARWICDKLSSNKLIAAKWNPAVIVGQSGDIDGMSWKEHQRPIIANFRSGIIRLLIATNVIQEGIDVPSCDCVIHFDILNNVTQLVQSRGRARYSSSKFVLICTEQEEAACKKIFFKEAETKSLVESIILSNFQRQEDRETISFLTCLSEMIYNAKHLKARKREKTLYREAQKQNLKKTMKVQISNVSKQQAELLSKFIETKIICQSISQPIEDQVLSEKYFFDVDCLIPDVDEKSTSQIFGKIFEAIREEFPCFDSLVRRKSSMYSVDQDIFQEDSFGVSLGNMKSHKEFISFYDWKKDSRIFICFNQKLLRIFIFDHKLYCFEIGFDSLDSFILLTFRDGIVDLAFPTIRAPVIYECEYPSEEEISQRFHQTSNFSGLSRRQMCDEFVRFRGARVPFVSFLPLDLFERAFCYNISMFLEDEAKSKLFYSIHAFEKIGINVLYTSSLQKDTFSFASLKIEEYFVKFCSKYSLDTAFKLNSLLTSRAPYITGHLNADFFDSLMKWNETQLKIIIDVLLEKYSLSNSRMISLEQEISEILVKYPSIHAVSHNIPAIFTPLNSCFVKFITVTPTRIICHEPKLMNSNRLLRHFGASNFVRVLFRDENERKLSASQFMLSMTPVFKKLAWLIKHGLAVCGHTFELLAMSSSQLRNHGCWFYLPSAEHPTDAIRAWLGDFSKIKNVAKFVARLGQSLSASVEFNENAAHSVNIQFQEIPDVVKYKLKVGNTVEYNFTDGIGCISPELMNAISSQFGLSVLPSALQVRIGGYKGVVAVYPEIKEKFFTEASLLLRPSMKKFDSAHKKIDILNFSEYIPCYLNRQVIMIISALQVPDESFSRLLQEMLLDLIHRLIDSSCLLQYLNSTYKCLYFTDSSLSFDRSSSNIPYSSEPFFRSLVVAGHKSQLADLLTKSRIYVPKGRILMGVVDESGILAPNQVFIQCSIDESKDSKEVYSGFPLKNGKFTVTGKVTVAKNPCMHPGDVRVLEAIDNPFLASFMHNVIVFPQTGEIPIPTMCSGSDLDGDLYFVTWDPTLIPLIQEEPLDYAELALDAKLCTDEITMDHVADFMIDFIKNDQLGVIANSHVAHVDQRELGVRDPLCRLLAGMFALAVDFPKTGFVAKIPDDSKVQCYPDFMQKHHLPTYESSNIIGKMFRKCREIVKINASTSLPVAINEAFLVDGFEEYLDSASQSFTAYEFSIRDILRRYNIDDEGEILSNSLLQNDMMGNEDKKDVIKLASLLVQNIRSKTRSSFFTPDVQGDERAQLKKASAWYYTCYSQSEGNQAKILSFPWLVEDVLMKIVESKSFDSLEISFSKSLISIFQAFNSKYSLSHHLLERYELLRTIESLAFQVSPSMQVKPYGSTVLFLFDLTSDLNIFVEHPQMEMLYEQLLKALKSSFPNSISTQATYNGLAPIKGSGSIFPFLIHFHSEGFEGWKDSLVTLNFFQKFPKLIPTWNFICRISRYLGLDKKISITSLSKLLVQICSQVFSLELLEDCHSSATVTSILSLFSRVESLEAEQDFVSEFNVSTCQVLWELMDFLCNEQKMRTKFPNFNHSLIESFFAIYNILAQSCTAEQALENIKRSPLCAFAEDHQNSLNLAQMRIMKKNGGKSAFFVAGSSKLLWQNCNGQKNVLRFSIYQGRKRPNHAQINCYSARIANQSCSNQFNASDDFTFKEFYHTCFRQFTYFRDNFSAEKFGKCQHVSIKLGHSYFTNMPRLFVQEPLSCTIENIHLALSKGYRCIDLDFQDLYSKAQAFFTNFSTAADEGEENYPAAENPASLDESTSEIDKLKKYLDASAENSTSTSPADVTLSLKRRKSKALSTLNSSFESYVPSTTSILYFLERFKFQLQEATEGHVAFVQLPSRESAERKVQLQIVFDGLMNFVEAFYAPIKWLQVDVVSPAVSQEASCDSKWDFRVALSTIKPIASDELLRSLIPESYFEAIKNGALFKQHSDGNLYANSLFKELGQSFVLRKSHITRFAPGEETLELFRAVYSSVIPNIDSLLMRKFRIKCLSLKEYSFPDPNTGKFLSCIEKNEVEPRILLDEETVKSSIIYDELVHLIWSLGNLFVQLASE